MIDDLVMKGVSEPYRMFTSRAEYRLSLRADNADQRLTALGASLGCVGGERARHFACEGGGAFDRARALLEALSLTPNEAARHGLKVNQDGLRRTAFELLALPEVSIESLRTIWPELAAIAPKTAAQIEIDAKYAVYLDRQTKDIDAFRRDEALAIPRDVDYAALPGLSNEIRARLETVRPRTMGQAGRIEGMTPAAMTLLAVETSPCRSRGSLNLAARALPLSQPSASPTRSWRSCRMRRLRRLHIYANLLEKWQTRGQFGRHLDPRRPLGQAFR